MNKSIGFVILVWNSEKVIEKCLSSIVDLKKITPKVVVVDNGSSDNTFSIVDSYVKNYPSIIDSIKYEYNKGTTVSRNAGLKKLLENQLDYYCILDSDTVINDEAFSILIDKMESNSIYGLIGPTMVSSSGIEQISARPFPTILEKFFKAVPIGYLQKIGERIEKKDVHDKNGESYPVDYLMSACWLIRPQVLDTVGLLDEKIFYAPEDAEYCIRVWKKGYQVAFCPKAKIIHEWQRLSKKKLISRINWEHIKGLAYMFKKHHYCLSVNNLKRSFNK